MHHAHVHTQNRYAELAFLCKIEEFPSNTVIFAEGEMGVTFYIMVYGEVSISVNKPKQGTVLLCTMGPGCVYVCVCVYIVLV